MYSFHKKECFNRAKDLIAKGDEASLRYACLELRQCIESVAYDKLRLYKKFVPEEELKNWQPQRVFTFLEKVAPNSTKDYTFKVTEQNTNSSLGKTVFLDCHRTLKSNHFKKTYNKLGSNLHTPTLLQQKDYSQKSSKLKTDLIKILNDLEPIVSSSFDENIGSVITFSCGYCGGRIYHRDSGLNIGVQVKCPNAGCGMLYAINAIQGGNFTYEPVNVDISCSCGKTIPINYSCLNNPSHVTCACGKILDITQEWVFCERT
ncbi:hypothetical protein [Iodobacter sp.]|uniref:hypothetical protein n=1 Tax=Iodobacter sp. TaxID=1915058 RepID=UPI0025FDB93A|nr:hypothetical protein [Iodobacter sp.]